MKSNRTQIKIWIPAILCVAGFLFSCVNELDSVKRVTSSNDAPQESTTGLHVIYTDSGYAQVEVFASIAETYLKENTKITQLKDGLRVNFFTPTGEIQSSLTAIYGEIDERTGKMFVRDSVELHNFEKDKTLETEELHYNLKDSSIYTDKSVVITSPKVIIYGIGARTTQVFDTTIVFKPQAEIYLDK